MDAIRCCSCGKEVDPNDASVLHEVVGWSRPRKAGGQNHVMFRQETGRLMCSVCVIREKSGVKQGQGSLL